MAKKKTIKFYVTYVGRGHTSPRLASPRTKGTVSVNGVRTLIVMEESDLVRDDDHDVLKPSLEPLYYTSNTICTWIRHLH